MTAGLFKEKVGTIEKPLLVIPIVPEKLLRLEVLSTDCPRHFDFVKTIKRITRKKALLNFICSVLKVLICKCLIDLLNRRKYKSSLHYRIMLFNPILTNFK